MKLITLLFTLFAFFLASCSSPFQHAAEYEVFRSQQVAHKVDLGEIKYIDRGKGEVIVLLHGVPSSGWLYRKMIDGLVAGGYRVIVPDMLGYGSSSSPKGYDIYSPEEQAKRLLSLMDRLGIKKWNHVFHDVGGMWTWELIRNHEHRINKLVMLNSINLAKGFSPPIRLEQGVVAKTAMWGYRNRFTNPIMIKALFKEGLIAPELISKSAKAGYQIPLLEGKTDGMYYFFTKTCNSLPNYEKLIKDTNLETAVIWGKHDQMLQWEPQAQDLSDMLKIRRKNIHVINAKHFIQEEVPDQVNRYILSFLKG